MRRRIRQLLILLTFGMLAAMGSDNACATDYFFEDFESIVLGPAVEEVVPGDWWSGTPPTGWTVDDSHVPGIGDVATDGTTEWAGWGFADKEAWFQVDGQRRDEFLLGRDTIAIADPDEWDDKPHDHGLYSAYMSTPTISIADFVEGELFLRFDSSFRPECCDDAQDLFNDQSPVITASYDGAAPVEILRWSSDPTSPDFKDDNSTNEHIVLAINAPAGTQTLQLDFGLERAENDWWWAIDDVQVTNTVPEPSSGLLLAGVVAGGWLCRRIRRRNTMVN